MRRVLFFLALVACGAAHDRPVATLSNSPRVGAELATLRDAFEHEPHDAALAKRFSAFVDAHPSDATAPLARLHLAHVLLEMNDVARARAQFDAVPEPHEGNTHDFWLAMRARLLRVDGHADEALAILQPLVGTVVDTPLRAILLEEISTAAIDAKRSLEAVAYLDGWLRSVPPHAHKNAHERVREELARIEPSVIEQTLEAMQGEDAGGYSTELQKLVAEALAKHALDAQDTRLAQRLIDSSLGRYLTGSVTGQDLRDLATSLRGSRAVVARTIGLILPTDTPELRADAADAARGAAFALGLPHAPTAPDDGTRLVTRADASSSLDASLEELAGAGAAVILVGFDEAAAERACVWSEQNGLAVITFAAPKTPPTKFCFVAGEARETSIALAIAEFERRAGASKKKPKLATVSGAVAANALAHTTSSTMELLPPFRCEPPYSRERLPLAEWSAQGVHDFLLSATSGCVRTLMPALPRGANVGLALESTSTEDDTRAEAGLHVFAVVPTQTAQVDEYTQKFGAKPSYWTALGRDGALLAHAAEVDLPTDRVTTASEISRRRETARSALAAAKATLWTTNAAGFSQDHTLPRALQIVQLSK